jgi:tRNA nucleotidyltransferase (CCA-adding enzyme)
MDLKNKLREGLINKPVTINIEIPLSDSVLFLNKIFIKHGYELYLVGGAVRDFLLDKPIKDYDLATNARPDTIQKILKEENLKTISTGEAYGVINTFINGEEFEIATYREDSASGDGRRPDSVTFSDIKTDVNRRDLTINALFYNIDKQVIVDYVGGIDDIKNGVVRTVGEPSKRFEEDKLRILRAIRFANRVGGELDSNIDSFLRKGYDLNDISKERIRDEFIKSIKSAVSVKRLMLTYQKYDMFKWILPDLNINTQFVDNEDVIIVIANLLINNDLSGLSKKLNKLAYSVNEIKDIRFLISLLYLTPDNAPTLKKNQVSGNLSVSEAQIIMFSTLHGIDKRLIDAFNEYVLTVNGKDVMDKYGVSGEDVGIKIWELERTNFNQIYKN